MNLKAGTRGILYSHHKRDRAVGYCVAVELVDDAPLDQEWINVRLLSEYYCLEVGEIVKTQRKWFKPGVVEV